MTEPRRAGGGPMIRAVAIYVGAALMAAWAILRAWDHFRGRPEPPREPEDGVQPLDPYIADMAMASRN